MARNCGLITLALASDDVAVETPTSADSHVMIERDREAIQYPP
jgi:hypothetical protein